MKGGFIPGLLYWPHKFKMNVNNTNNNNYNISIIELFVQMCHVLSCVKDKEPFYFRFKNQPLEQLSGEKTGSTLSLLPPFKTKRFNEQFKMTESPRFTGVNPEVRFTPLFSAEH